MMAGIDEMLYVSIFIDIASCFLKLVRKSKLGESDCKIRICECFVKGIVEKQNVDKMLGAKTDNIRLLIPFPSYKSGSPLR